MGIVRREMAILLSGDLTLFILSLWAALFFRRFEVPSLSFFLENLIPFVPLFIVSLGVFYIAGLYEKQTTVVKRTMGERIFWAQFANTTIAAIIFFILPLSIAPKTILFLYLIVSVLSISVWRFSLFPRLFTLSRDSALLLGSGEAVRELHEEVNGNNRYRIFFEGHIDTGESVSPEQLFKRIEESITRGVQVLVIDGNDDRVQQTLPLLYDVMIRGITVVEFSSLYEDIFDRVPLQHINHAWLLENLPKEHAAYDFFKRCFDVLVAACGLVLAAPFVVVAAGAIFLDGGNPFITPERVGKGGVHIRLYKLRTMLFFDNGDPERQKQNRVTRLGAFLRKTRIDELPQLWNIFRGELSFIGPRPELPAIAAVYEREIPYYQVRHLITPGLSGWAQIKDYDAPRGNADIEKTFRKLSYDLLYLKQRSFGFDIAIALKTVRALLSFSGK